MKASAGRAPIFKHPHKAALRQVFSDDILKYVCESKPLQRKLGDQVRVIDRDRGVNPYLQCFAAARKRPTMDRPIMAPAVVDASVLVQVVRRRR